ncbi:MAG: hypothetical protein ABI822_29545 [Bryobacteraceae bacterium]
MAHEIGHVLLGPGAHSPNGLMRENWYAKDLLRAEQGTQVFAPQQKRRLRKGRSGNSGEMAALSPR